MIYQFLTSQSLASNFDETKSLRTRQVEGGVFVQYEWSGVTGTLDGIIEVFASVNGKVSKIEEIDIASASNTSDCYGVQYNYTMENIRFKYTKNNITGGNLTIVGSQIVYGG